MVFSGLGFFFLSIAFFGKFIFSRSELMKSICFFPIMIHIGLAAVISILQFLSSINFVIWAHFTNHARLFIEAIEILSYVNWLPRLQYKFLKLDKVYKLEGELKLEDFHKPEGELDDKLENLYKLDDNLNVISIGVFAFGFAGLVMALVYGLFTKSLNDHRKSLSSKCEYSSSFHMK